MGMVVWSGFFDWCIGGKAMIYDDTKIKELEKSDDKVIARLANIIVNLKCVISEAENDASRYKTALGKVTHPMDCGLEGFDCFICKALKG